MYTAELLEWYSEEEWKIIDLFIDHDKDEGYTYAAIIYNTLNQSLVTNLLTVDEDNISLGINQALDDKTSFENKTGFDAINLILAATNSVLYILDDTVYVAPRTAGATVAFNFYGQASRTGAENIINIQNIRSGLNRVINNVTWSNTSLVEQDDTSVARYGVFNADISYDFMTNDTKRGNLLDSILQEFKNPKMELDISTPMSLSSLQVNLLDKVSIDYPVIYTSSDALPICGIAVCGSAKLPRGIWSFYILPTQYFKVMGKKLDIKKSLQTFTLRLI
jgi:hypothetical protein